MAIIYFMGGGVRGTIFLYPNYKEIKILLLKRNTIFYFKKKIILTNFWEGEGQCPQHKFFLGIANLSRPNILLGVDKLTTTLFSVAAISTEYIMLL